RVVKERVGRLIAAEIDDPKKLPLPDFVDPRLARRHDVAVDRVLRIEFALDDHRKYLSVSEKPRAFSGREVRQGSKGPGGGTRRIESLTGFGAYFGFRSSGCWQVFRITSVFISARSST